MKIKMSIIEFLGIPPKTYESDFPQHEITDSSPYSEDSSLPMFNPCSGLPLIDKNSLIDVGGNQFGICDDLGSGLEFSAIDDLYQISGTADGSLVDDMSIDNSSILSVTTDSFDDATTNEFLDDGMADSIMDDPFDNDWSQW